MTTNNPIFRIILILILILLLSNCKIVFYGIEQGIGQLKLIHNSVPIEEAVEDSIFADSLTEKLLLIEEIKRYAIDSIGLKESKNYTTVYNQKGKPIVWIIYATPRYIMKAHLWKYPVVGELPYIGFFKKHKAKKEIEKFEADGFDVRVGTVSAWSTLGYFKDPILSNVLYKSEGEIAELIIHELTHVTLFVKGEAQFNENLATFVGVTGAKKFLISKYGKNSKQYNEYIEILHDSEILANYFLKGGQKLDSLYNTFADETSEKIKEKQKKVLINNIIRSIDSLELFDKTLPEKFQKNIDKLNNAFFIGYIMYYTDVSALKNEYNQNFDQNLKKYMSYLCEKYK